MRKWFRNALVALAVAVVAAIVWPALHGPPNPVYKGEPLSEWLRGYDISGLGESERLWRETDEAVRGIGTNVIPILLDMLQARDSSLKLKAIGLAQKQHFIEINPVSADILNWEAANAFGALGASASNAVPELIRIYGMDNTEDSIIEIVNSLGGVGPAAKRAIPLLLEVANKGKKDVIWFACIRALGEIRSEPEIVLPVLTKLLNDSDPNVRRFAAQGLGEFGVDGKPATSELLELLKDENLASRDTALNSLGKIYTKPEWTWASPTPLNTKFKPFALIRVINSFAAVGTNAEPAVPALIKFLADPDEGVRSSATNALKAIDPEAAAKAGVR